MRAGREETAASDGLDRLAAPLQTPDAQIEILQREQRIREAVSRLPERCRQLVRMLFYEDPPLPYAEVAKRLGLAVGSIGLTRSRCLKKLEAGLVEAGL
jgi:RNA polymerase sigma factor (sigma-70 family)